MGKRSIQKIVSELENHNKSDGGISVSKLLQISLVYPDKKDQIIQPVLERMTICWHGQPLADLCRLVEEFPNKKDQMLPHFLKNLENQSCDIGVYNKDLILLAKAYPNKKDQIIQRVLEVTWGPVDGWIAVAKAYPNKKDQIIQRVLEGDWGALDGWIALAKAFPNKKDQIAQRMLERVWVRISPSIEDLIVLAKVFPNQKSQIIQHALECSKKYYWNLLQSVEDSIALAKAFPGAEDQIIQFEIERTDRPESLIALAEAFPERRFEFIQSLLTDVSRYRYYTARPGDTIVLAKAFPDCYLNFSLTSDILTAIDNTDPQAFTKTIKPKFFKAIRASEININQRCFLSRMAKGILAQMTNKESELYVVLKDFINTITSRAPTLVGLSTHALIASKKFKNNKEYRERVLKPNIIHQFKSQIKEAATELNRKKHSGKKGKTWPER